jgi:hypothetical protein
VASFSQVERADRPGGWSEASAGRGWLAWLCGCALGPVYDPAVVPFYGKDPGHLPGGGAVARVVQYMDDCTLQGGSARVLADPQARSGAGYPGGVVGLIAAEQYGSTTAWWAHRRTDTFCGARITAGPVVTSA